MDILDEAKLQEGLQAIEVLTDKLINLAVVENKFLEMTQRLESEVRKCEILHSAMVRAEANIETHYAQNMHYFQFRYRWMEKLFCKYVWFRG